MPSKVTFFYHDNLGGFSESWIDNANAPATYPVGILADYIKARMAISGLQTTWDYVRISDATGATKRRVRIALPTNVALQDLSVPLIGQYAQGRSGQLQNSDFAGTRFLLRKISIDLFQARIFLAGFPDNQVDEGGLYKPSGTFPTLLNTFIATCKGLGYGWTSYTVPIVGSTAAVQSMVTGVDGICTITAAVIGVNPPIFSPPIQPGQHIVVRIANQTSPKNANGTFTVLVTGPLTCRTVKPLSITNFVLGNGTITVKSGAQFKAIDSAQVMRIVKRGPGRPFGLYHGKQPVRPRG